jgi:hypothetical protein
MLPAHTAKQRFRPAGQSRPLRQKISLYNRGLVSFKDIAASGEKLPAEAMRQIEAVTKNLPPHIDHNAIREFLDTLRWPLYFLDFETFKEAVPSLDGQSPYQQIPFQYSLHIQAAPGAAPEHKEFLAAAGTDPRRAIAESLCANIPETACGLAYYMSFEKGHLKELAAIFPDLAKHLTAIHDNINDLIIPFKKGAYYCKEQRGSNSIKDVLPALFPHDPELDYHALDLIHNGGEAMNVWPELPQKTAEEQQKIRAALLAYCRLDTLAMVKILDKLHKENTNDIGR